jgi:His-Xaa-Ser system protein HxsD
MLHIRRIPRIIPITLAVSFQVSRVTVEFDSSTQSIGALREAAYRLIGTGSCHIEKGAGGFLCHLEPSSRLGQQLDGPQLRQRFFDLVTDENPREKIAFETNHVRDVILALAFGALAQDEDYAKMEQP